MTTAAQNPMTRLVTVFPPRPEAFGGSGKPAEINWSAIGSVTPADARLFAAALIDAADKAEAMNADQPEPK